MLDVEFPLIPLRVTVEPDGLFANTPPPRAALNAVPVLSLTVVSVSTRLWPRSDSAGWNQMPAPAAPLAPPLRVLSATWTGSR